jgi:hypothetical protein
VSAACNRVNEIDRAVFLRNSNPDVTCPFYMGHGTAGGPWERHQKYCTCPVVVERAQELPAESMLAKCCNIFQVSKTIENDIKVNKKIEEALKHNKWLRKKVSGSKKLCQN